MNTQVAARWSISIAPLLAVLVAGCGLFEDPGPDTARLHLEGTEGVRVQLVTSTRFTAGQPTADGTVPTEVLQAETTRVTLPFEARYDISRAQRFLARVVRFDLASDGLVVRGWIDGEERFTRTGTTSPADSVLEFVYSYQAFRPGGGDVF